MTSTDVTLLTVATSWTSNVSNYVVTAKAAGWNPVILGLGSRWVGFVTKMALVQQVCEEMPPDAMVVCTDSSDVLVMQSPAYAMEVWEKYYADKRLVYGVEATCAILNCLPIPSIMTELFGGDRAAWPALRYMNGGLFMGRASAIAAMFKWMLQNQYRDDQIGAAAYWTAVGATAGGLGLDTDRRLFVNDLRGLSGAKPGTAVFMHFPGIGEGLYRVFGVPSAYATTGKQLLGQRYMRPDVPVFVYGILWLVILLLFLKTCGAMAAPWSGHKGTLSIALALSATCFLTTLIRNIIQYDG